MAPSLSLSNIRSSKGFIVATICIATFTDGFIYGVVAPVIPFILRDQVLVPKDQLQMSTSILIATFALADFFGAPLCAWYVDRYRSRRVPWYAGIVLISTGTIFFGFANHFWMLVVSRILQGFSSSILYTVGLAVLVDTVDHDQVGQWMGTAMSANNIGMIISPLLGGIIYDKSGKMWVFAIMVALDAVDVVLRLLMNEQRSNSRMRNASPKRSHDLPRGEVQEKEKVEPKGHYLDVARPRTAVSALFEQYLSLQLSLHSNLSQVPIISSDTPVSSASDPAQTTPMRSRRLPGIISLLNSPRLLAALYGCFINECIVSSLCAVLPLFVNKTFNWTSLQAGLLFLTIAIPAFAGPLAGAMADRLGARWVAVAGFLLTAPPLILLRLVDHNSKEQIILLCGLLTLAGCTIILFLSPLGAECTFVAEELSKDQETDLYASSFSLMNCSLAAAALLGPLACGGLQQRFGWKATTIALGTLCASGAVPCALVTGNGRAVNDDHENEV
ncbi:MFS general substrate transporter [Mytilinidion resinicola]|uniref:MFS general substrate transporter n=1 Tax=Mytilinidion resinicola TaxID=574789 RepID=A0A6A6YT54_9PEZI|nr:MFS general substrate transporter [Mytilinidion resinicola]KAF2811951.1 MFS general substrate transporter [Mytilinidion resinicola]